MPTEETHHAPDAASEHWLTEALKKQSAAVIFAVIWAFYTFIWNSHDSARDLSYKVDANTKAIEKLQLADKEQADTQNQFLIALTKVSEAQNRLASDVRDIQEQQRKNTEMLLNRK